MTRIRNPRASSCSRRMRIGLDIPYLFSEASCQLNGYLAIGAARDTTARAGVNYQTPSCGIMQPLAVKGGVSHHLRWFLVSISEETGADGGSSSTC